MDALCPYRVRPLMFDGPGFSVRPGRLWREGREAQLRRWGETVGVELRDGECYLLFESTRLDARADHEVTAQPTRRFFDRMWHLTPEWRKASVSLAPGRRMHEGSQHDAVISFEKAQRYVDAFYQYGTHFISAVELGDTLFQVVAVRAEAAAEVCGFWRAQGGGSPVSGAEALPFGGLLGVRHARAVGPIVSLAGDPRLEASVADGSWADPRSLSGTSLLRPWCSGPERAAERLQGFAAAASVRIELTSLARFIEYYRAINFERVLRGALLQRWGDRVVLPLRRMPSIERTIARSLSGNTAPAGSRVLSCRQLERWRGAEGGPQLIQLVDAALDSRDAPSLELSTEAFEHGGLVCQALSGVLTLVHAGRDERDVVVDGLRFTSAAPDPVASWPRVRVRGDVHRLDSRHLSALMPRLEIALADLTATLTRPLDREPRDEAVAFADWLTTLLPARSSDPEVARLRAWALYLARVEPNLSEERGRLEREVQRRMDTQLGVMASLALQVDDLLRDHEAESRALSRAPLSRDAGSQRAGLGQHAAQIRSARRQLGERHLLLLRELEAAHVGATRRAAVAYEDAGEQLLRHIASFRSSNEPGLTREAGELLELLESAPRGGPWASMDQSRLRCPRDPLLAAGVCATAREVHARRELGRLDVIERVCAAASESGDTFGAFEGAERALLGDGAVEPADVIATSAARLTLQALLLRGTDQSAEREQATRALLAAWERFENARDGLLTARRVSCRQRFETWLHNRVLEPAAVEGARATASGAAMVDDMALERALILTTLSQALRWQQGGLKRGAAAAKAPATLEPGAVGRLIIQQLRSSALSSRSGAEMQMTGSPP